MTTSALSPELDDEVVYPHPFGPYALLCALGRGGMGAVHLAKQGSVAGIEKYCVVKTLRRRHADNEEYITRFMDEARLVVHLAHRNICPIFDVGRVGHKYYLAMELIEGRDLHTLVESCWAAGRAIPPAIALHIACEVLEALDYAHRRAHPVTGEPLHIVHRDVSPHNVMVNFEGEVKLIDFGLAASSLKVERTDPKVVLGKLSYMSREHLRAQAVDGRHDLFGVAVMLYEMLVGERYYADVEQERILPMLAEGTHVPRRLASLDAELREILSRSLASDVEQRTKTCGELRDQLQQYMLRRQLGAGARDLRTLVEPLFPGEQTSVRSLLQRFTDVRPPPREEDQSTVIARAQSSTGTMKVVGADEPRLRPTRGRSSSPPAADGLDFGEVDSIDAADGTNPGVSAPFVKPPVTEPTGRIPAPFAPPPVTDHGEHEATTVLPRAVHAEVVRTKARRSAALIAAIAAVCVVALAAGAWALLSQQEAPASLATSPAALAPKPSAELPAPSSSSAPEASEAEKRAPAAASGSPEAKRAPVAEKTAPLDTPSAPKAAASPVPDEDAADAASAAEAPKQKARARRSRPSAAPKPPPLPASATPEAKLRYLDAHCRKHGCARQLVDRFKSVGIGGMSTDEVRAFWPRVNACIQTCTR